MPNETMEGEVTLALVRLSAELSTKARGTRRRFMRHLVGNVREALASTGAEFHVASHWTRLYVRSNGGPESLRVLQGVAGLSSYSIVLAKLPADLDEIVRVGAELFTEAVRGKRYAVRARRSGTHDFTSQDVMNRLGAALNAEATVDLDDPQVEVEIEVRDQDAYFYSGREECLGGLPLGVEGRAVCLLSGGFDSATAAWMMLKRGVHLDYVFCNLAGESYERSVAQVAKLLADRWSFGSRPTLHVLDFGPVLDELRAKTHSKYWQLVLKRLMYRAAARVAGEVGGQAIVTGEAIGQVSSQTLSNLAAIDRSSALPVFRPLLGFDKMDIIDLSRRIGTHEISSKVKEYCAIAPGNPVTSARPQETENEERKMDLSVLDQAIERRRILDLKELASADLVLPYLFVDEVPADATVIDVREDDEFDAWHYPGAHHHPVWELMANPRQLDRKPEYVLYCDRGTQSAQVAEKLQREGYEAYAFRGGTSELRKRAEATVG